MVRGPRKGFKGRLGRPGPRVHIEAPEDALSSGRVTQP